MEGACVEHTEKQQENTSGTAEGRRKEQDETRRVVSVIIIVAPVGTFG